MFKIHKKKALLHIIYNTQNSLPQDVMMTISIDGFKRQIHGRQFLLWLFTVLSCDAIWPRFRDTSLESYHLWLSTGTPNTVDSWSALVCVGLKSFSRWCIYENEGTDEDKAINSSNGRQQRRWTESKGWYFVAATALTNSLDGKIPPSNLPKLIPRLFKNSSISSENNKGSIKRYK